MLATPLKGRGLQDCLPPSPRRETVPLKAVCLSSIPGGTPLKHLAKFQAASVPAVGEAVLACQMGLERDTQRGDVFQSTLLSRRGTCDEGFLDISKIEPAFGDGLGQPTFHPTEEAMTKKALLKRKACDPLSLESPAKSSLRMDSRTALAGQQNRLLGRELLDTQSTTDFILTPTRHLEFLERRDKKNAAGSTQQEGLFKKPLTKARAHSSSHQAKQNGPISAAARLPIVTSDPAAEQRSPHDGEDSSTTCSQDSAFHLEATELENDTFHTYAADVTCGSDALVPPAGLPREERALREGSQQPGQSGRQALVAKHQRLSHDLCDILATPKVRIPRKQRPAGAASKVPSGVPCTDTTYNYAPEEVQQRILLSDWRIKVLNDTAIFLEGKRRQVPRCLFSCVYMLPFSCGTARMALSVGGFPIILLEAFAHGSFLVLLVP
ncbi:UNVERIFIED_CONTAM: hypothetical protein K2H54_004864 [Gekko kuhli]